MVVVQPVKTELLKMERSRSRVRECKSFCPRFQLFVLEIKSRKIYTIKMVIKPRRKIELCFQENRKLLYNGPCAMLW
jgi:hypothetical protein